MGTAIATGRPAAAGWVWAVAGLAGTAAVAVAASRLPAGWAAAVLLGWLLTLLVVGRDAVRDVFGPVFVYEVVRIGRRRLTFVLRGVYVFVVAALLAMMYLEWVVDRARYSSTGVVSPSLMSRFATEFFYTFAAVQFVVVAFLTPAYVAAVITDEKERKTLEFLLATDLRNREIVFGKLAARVTTLLMYVLAGLPVIAFLQLFGGVAGEQLVVVFGATVVTALALSAVSVCFSVFLKRSRDAIGLTYLAVTLYAIGSVMLAAATAVPTPQGWWNTPVELFGTALSFHDLCRWLATGNPLWHVIRLNAPAPIRRTDLLAVLAEFTLFWAVAGSLFVGLAVARLRSATLKQTYAPVKAARRGRAARDKPEVGDDPMFWKEVFAESSGRRSWAMRIIGAVLAVGVFIPLVVIVYNTFIDPWPGVLQAGPVERWDRFAEAVSAWVRGVTGVFGLLLFLGAAVRGATAVSTERDRDTWVSLIATPLSAGQMLWGKWWGCVLGARRPFAVLAAVWAVGLAVGAVHPLAVPGLLLLALLYLSGFSWLGLFFSVNARTSLVATVRALFAALFLAGGYWVVLALCCGLPMSVMGVKGRDADHLAQVGLGFTPPFVFGWSPLPAFDEYETEPFSTDMKHGLGVITPLVGAAGWLGLNVLLAGWTHRRFLQATNRDHRPLPEERRVRRPRAEGEAGDDRVS